MDWAICRLVNSPTVNLERLFFSSNLRQTFQRVDQSANCRVRELSSPWVDWQRVGLSVNCPVTSLCGVVVKCKNLIADSWYEQATRDPINSNHHRRYLTKSISQPWNKHSACDLLVPWTLTSTYGPCSFTVCEPVGWNSVPPSRHNPSFFLRQFYRRLKTFPIHQAYEPCYRDCCSKIGTLQIPELNWTAINSPYQMTCNESWQQSWSPSTKTCTRNKLITEKDTSKADKHRVWPVAKIQMWLIIKCG